MKPSMPRLVDHLRSYLDAVGTMYVYRPPAPVPGWEF
jgi:hypothetical protein